MNLSEFVKESMGEAAGEELIQFDVLKLANMLPVEWLEATPDDFPEEGEGLFIYPDGTVRVVGTVPWMGGRILAAWVGKL